MAAHRPAVARWLAAACEGALFLLIGAVTLLYTPRLSDNILGKTAVVLLLAPAVLLLWSAARAAAGQVVLGRSPILLPFASYLAVAAVAAVAARTPRLALESWLPWALWLGLFAVVADAGRDQARLRRLLRCLLCAAVAVPAIGLLQVFHVDPVGLPTAFRGTPLSTLGNTNFVAHYLEVVLPLALALAVGRIGSKVDTALAGAAALLGTAHLVLAGSRGGWLGVAVALLVMALLGLRRRRWLSRALLAVLVAALLSPVASFVLGSVPIGPATTARDAVAATAAEAWRKAMTTFDEANFSRVMRFLIWRDTARLIGDQPWLGVGPGHYGLELPAHRTSTGQREWRALMGGDAFEAYHAHNEYLETWAESGLAGVATLLWLLGAALWTAFTASRRLRWQESGGPDAQRRCWRAVALGCLGGITAAAVHAAFSFNLRDPVSGTHLWVLCGLAAAAGWQGRQAGGGDRLLEVTSAGKRVAAVAVAASIAAAATWLGVCVLAGDAYFQRAEQHIAEGHSNRAILALRQAVEWRGDEFRYLHQLGRVAGQAGRHAEAAAALQRSLEVHPHNPQAIRLLAQELIELRRPGEAVPPLRHAVDIDPLTADNYALLAEALRHAGEPDAAAQARRQAMSLSFDPRVLVSMAFDYLAAGKADTALAVLEEAARTAPRDGYVLGNLGAVYLKAERYAEAEGPLRLALSLDPEHRAEWGGDLALALEGQDRLEEALSQAETAARAVPGDDRWTRLVARIRKRLPPSPGEDAR